jgi:hypothetical protein
MPAPFPGGGIVCNQTFIGTWLASKMGPIFKVNGLRQT